jgi:hypothetical protein
MRASASSRTPAAGQQLPEDIDVGARHYPRVLVISPQAERFRALPLEVEIVAAASEAVSRLADRSSPYGAIVAPVKESDGRETGYRVARMMRCELGVVCPIVLFSDWVTPSTRAFAIQCGATRLLVDDHHLLEDLVDILTVPHLTAA